MRMGLHLVMRLVKKRLRSLLAPTSPPLAARRPGPRRRSVLQAMAIYASIVVLAPILPPWFYAHAAATIFVSAVDGSNADNGTTWALAKQTVAGALAIAVANDIIVVDNLGTFSAGAAITWTPVARVAVISVTRSGTVSYTPSSGAVETCGTGTFNFNITGATNGSMYVYGMTLRSGNAGASQIRLLDTTATMRLEMDSCNLDLASYNSATVAMLVGATGGGEVVKFTSLKDCTFSRTDGGGGSTSAGAFIKPKSAVLEIINPTIAFASVAGKVTALVGAGSTTDPARFTMRDGDISANWDGPLVAVAGIQSGALLFKNLKLNASTAITSGAWAQGIGSITLRNVSSDNTDYVFGFYNAYGTLTADVSVFKNSGASFNSQTVSWKIVTTSVCDEWRPFITPLLQIWDTSTAGQTPTVSIAQASGATNLNDRDAWMDIDSAASATATNYNYKSGRNAAPFTGSAVDWAADSGATWTGLSTPNKQLLSLGTVTPARAGLLQGRVAIAKASTTVYLDAKIVGIS